jgi:hypothetical protein
MVNPLDLEPAELDALRALQASPDDQPDAVDPWRALLRLRGLIGVARSRITRGQPGSNPG